MKKEKEEAGVVGRRQSRCPQEVTVEKKRRVA